MAIELHAQQQWLHTMVGEWKTTTWMDEAKSRPYHGVETVRALGSHWVVIEATGDMPGAGHTTMLISLAYDPKTERFKGTWLGSMMSHLWIYDGHREGDELVLEVSGPSMSGDGSTARYRDVMGIGADGGRWFHSEMQTPDDSWKTVMTVEYERTA